VIRRALIGVCAVVLALSAFSTGAQPASEHASHHPGADASAAPTVAPGMAPGAPMTPAAGGAPAKPGGGMMADMMGKMMAPTNPSATAPAAAGPTVAPGVAGLPAPGGCMGGSCGAVSGATPIYPSLMTLPALTPEKRAEIEALASQQIDEGLARLDEAAQSLEYGAQAGDNAAMQQSVGLMREGLDELGAGIAARRVLSEGKAPRNLALDWFKREMNLASPIARDEPRALFGVTPFHLFTMLLLITFALAMVVMYFFKMRRTAALFGRLEGGSGPPPPGSAPPLAGTAAPDARNPSA
jgi:glycine betaine catabolism B